MENIQELKIIYRREEPTKNDTADQYALCKVGYDQNGVNEHEFYIQISHDPENPNWISIGFLDGEKILLNLIELIKK